MFKLILIICLSALFMIFLFGFSVIRFIFQALLGRPMQKKQTQTKSGQNRNKTDFSTAKQKKIITRNEGEYVDYVEVKDHSSNNN